jgi:predicted transcriptional regulator
MNKDKHLLSKKHKEFMESQVSSLQEQATETNEEKEACQTLKDILSKLDMIDRTVAKFHELQEKIIADIEDVCDAFDIPVEEEDIIAEAPLGVIKEGSESSDDSIPSSPPKLVRQQRISPWGDS